MHSLSAATAYTRSLELCKSDRLAAYDRRQNQTRAREPGGSNQDVCHLAHGQTNDVDYLPSVRRYVTITERHAGTQGGRW